MNTFLSRIIYSFLAIAIIAGPSFAKLEIMEVTKDTLFNYYRKDNNTRIFLNYSDKIPTIILTDEKGDTQQATIENDGQAMLCALPIKKIESPGTLFPEKNINSHKIFLFDGDKWQPFIA